MSKRGLMVKAPWSQLILDGKKTWELRGSKTKIRGRVAIIESGTKRIHGYVDVVDCLGPFTLMELAKTEPKHHVSFVMIDSTLPYVNTYAWVLKNPKRLKRPKPYVHPQGAIIWVNLEKP